MYQNEDEVDAPDESSLDCGDEWPDCEHPDVARYRRFYQVGRGAWGVHVHAGCVHVMLKVLYTVNTVIQLYNSFKRKCMYIVRLQRYVHHCVMHYNNHNLCKNFSQCRVGWGWFKELIQWTGRLQ